jgi:hypothetical protein
MDPKKMYTVDLSSVWSQYVEPNKQPCLATALICKKNVTFIGQLVRMPRQWQLHGDGKHKLHHGKWILVTFGTHDLTWDVADKQYRHSFRYVARRQLLRAFVDSSTANLTGSVW